ncbi:hypothetical protein GW17_00051332 [Ensete ventricosum]|nr:hypothetical protein GW17_00051332 [Ensete ventricosum]
MSYAHSLSHTRDKLRSFQSYLRWMCIYQSDTGHVMVGWSLFLLGVFIPTAFHFVFSYTPIYHAYDVVVLLSLTSASSFSYLCLSTFVRHYGLHRFLFLDKIDFFLT